MATQEERRKRWHERSPYWVGVSDDTRGRDRHHSPSAARNAGPIGDRLAERLPASGRALEIASGTGEHVVAFARRFPGIAWTPSDPHPEARRSIAAWIAWSGLTNARAPLELDVTAAGWSAAVAPDLDAAVAINLLHIAPWAACEGLLSGAAGLLKPAGLIAVYGCFTREGRHLSDENAEFDRSLRHRNPEWGVRDVAEVTAEAERHALVLAEVIDMPADNLMLVLRPA